MKLTLEQEFTVYRKMLDDYTRSINEKMGWWKAFITPFWYAEWYIRRHITSYGFCYYLHMSAFVLELDDLTQLAAARPVRMRDVESGYWFKQGDRKQRAELLAKVLKATELKINELQRATGEVSSPA